MASGSTHASPSLVRICTEVATIGRRGPQDQPDRPRTDQLPCGQGTPWMSTGADVEPSGQRSIVMSNDSTPRDAAHRHVLEHLGEHEEVVRADQRRVADNAEIQLTTIQEQPRRRVEHERRARRLPAVEEAIALTGAGSQSKDHTGETFLEANMPSICG